MAEATSYPCPCGSTRAATERCTGGPHYAKLVCVGCGRHIKFVPRPEPPPGPPPAALASACPDRPDCVPLRGHARVVAWANSIRETLLFRCRRAGDDDSARILRSIADASWFVANRDRRPDSFRWPERRQLDLDSRGGPDDPRPGG